MKVTAKLAEDTKVLIPNPEHKNFTEGNETIEKETVVTGEPKVIAGLRRGEPFEYKLFLTDNNQLIYFKKLKQMEPTESKSGADSSVSATKVNLRQTVLARPTVLGAIGGAVIAFGYAKYKKHDLKKAGIYAVVGAVAGFVVGKVIEHTGSIKASK